MVFSSATLFGTWPLDHPLEPFICIDRQRATADYNFSQVPPVTRTWMEHMGPIRGRERERERGKKRAHLSISIRVSGVSVQWQIVRKVWFITRIAPGIFVLGDVTKCDIIARPVEPRCIVNLLIAWHDRWHAGTACSTRGTIWFTTGLDTPPRPILLNHGQPFASSLSYRFSYHHRF